MLYSNIAAAVARAHGDGRRHGLVADCPVLLAQRLRHIEPTHLRVCGWASKHFVQLLGTGIVLYLSSPRIFSSIGWPASIRG
jgi:hypothetical protein